MASIFHGIELTALYFVVGLVVLIVGRKVFDLFTPYSMNREVAERNNVAAGVTEGGFYVGLAIITHASISGAGTFSFGYELLSSFIYFVIGLIALGIGRRVLEWTTPFSINKEIVEDQNVAVGAVEAGFYIALAVVIHAAVS